MLTHVCIQQTCTVIPMYMCDAGDIYCYECLAWTEFNNTINKHYTATLRTWRMSDQNTHQTRQCQARVRWMFIMHCNIYASKKALHAKHVWTACVECLLSSLQSTVISDALRKLEDCSYIWIYSLCQTHVPLPDIYIDGVRHKYPHACFHASSPFIFSSDGIEY